MNRYLPLAFLLLCACRGPALPPSLAGSGADPSAIAPTQRLPAAVPAGHGELLTGTLVELASNRPLANIPVRLEPWTPCTVVRLGTVHTSLGRVEQRTLDCPQPLSTTQTHANGSFSVRAAPGHYLLVIGNDEPNDTTWATVHDSIYVYPGMHTLLAPVPCPQLYTFYVNNEGYHAAGPPFDGRCLPPIPYVKLHPSQQDGDYRLTPLTAEERECTQAFQTERTAFGVEPVTVDEWMTENNRAVNEAVVTYGWRNDTDFALLTNGFGTGDDPNTPVKGYPYNGCFWGLISEAIGVPNSHARAYATDPRTHWLAAGNIPWHPNRPKDSLWLGGAQFPRDPRNFQDPAVRYWP